MKILKTLTILSILLFSNQVFAKNDLKNIFIIGTGGTISGSGESEIEAKYSPSKININEIIKSSPNITNIANVKSEQVFQEASQNFNHKHWIILAKKVNELLKKRSVDGIVITHGTDTLEETAYFLNLVINSKKPIVFVGSMRPSTALSADGPLNLYNAVALASDKKSYGKGVLVLMNDKIFSARDVKKTHTTNVDSFSSNSFGELGQAYFGEIDIYYQTTKKHTYRGEFKINDFDDSIKADIIYIYTNFDHTIIDNLIASNTNAIIVAGVGDGNVSAETLEKLKIASEKGILIVRSSRLDSGKVIKNVEIADDEYGFAVANNLSPQKARILAILALSKTKNIKKIQEIFNSY